MSNGPRDPPCPTCGCDGGNKTLLCEALHKALVVREVAAERAAIASWLRTSSLPTVHAPRILALVAEAIERGEHLVPKESL
jgi:hypothetical protein